jgi:hypothetical protein
MSSQGVVIKVSLAGAAAARRAASATGKAIKGMGADSEHASRKVRLAEASMHRFEHASHKLHHTIRELAGVTGFAGLTFGAAEVVKSAIEAQTAQAKLTQTMKSSGLSWRKYGKEVNETLEKQSLATGFSRGQVTDSFSNFIRTTGSVRKATQLNNIAFDVARTKGLGLAQTQSLLARVYNGSYTGLKRLGIGITPITVAQDKLKASGQKYTAAQLARAKADDKAATSTQALRIVQQKFSGQASAYGRTAQGSVDKLKAAVEAIQERVGAVLLPYVARGAQKLAELTKKLLENWPKISATIKKNVDKVKTALTPLLDWVSQHRKGVAEFAAALLGIGLGLKAVKSVGHFTGLDKVASIATGRHGIGKLVSKYGGATPVYVVNWGGKLERTSTRKKVLNAVEKFGPGGALAGDVIAGGGGSAAAGAAGVGLAALTPLGGITWLAITQGHHNLRTKGIGASNPSNPLGTVPVPGFGGATGTMTTTVNPAAVTAPYVPSAAGNAILAGGTGSPFVIHTSVNIDGKTIARAVTHAASKQKALK